MLGWNQLLGNVSFLHQRSCELGLHVLAYIHKTCIDVVCTFVSTGPQAHPIDIV